MNLYSTLELSSTDLNIVSFIGAGGKSTAMFRLADELVARGRRVITTTTTRVAAEQILTAPGYVSLDGTELPIDEIKRVLDQHAYCMVIGRASAQRLEGDKKAGIEPEQVDALAAHADELDLAAILVEADGSRMLPVKAPADHEPAIPSSTTHAVSLVGMDALGLSLRDPLVHRPETMRALLGLPATGEVRLAPIHVARLLNHPLGGRRGVPDHARFTPMLNKTDTPPRLAQARLIARELAHTGQPALISAVGRNSDPILERWGGLAIVVMAAGASKRMGKPKQLVEIDGEAMVLRAVHTAAQSGADLVLIVTGAHTEAVTRLLADHGYHKLVGAGLALARGTSTRRDSRAGASPAPTELRIVHNNRWREGQSTTVHAAIEALPPEIQAAIFLPVDQPYLPAHLLRRLQQAWRNGAELAAPEVNGELRGAPALFSRKFWPDLLAVRGDIGGREILRQNEDQVAPIPADANLLRDIDSAEDLD